MVVKVGGLVQERKFAGTTMAFSRDYSTVSKYQRGISSTVLLVAVLAIFITINSWVLFSFPIGSVIPRYFSGADHARNSVSPVSSEAQHVHNHSTRYEYAPSDSRSEELASERPLSSHNTDHMDHGVNDNASEVESLNPSISPEATSTVGLADSECDLYHGQWFYNSVGPLYTNNSCPILTQAQNCQGNGRPDNEYENWRWKPNQCELPRFNATKFLDLMSGKTLAFIGDSLARNQMESLMCLLWQVEVPINRGNRRMQRWLFRSKSVTIIRIWSAWLVHHTTEPLSYAPEGVAKLHLDIADENFIQLLPSFDVVVINNGHWFTKRSAYVLNNEIVGTQLWNPPENHPLTLSNTEAFQISTATSLTAMATHQNYSGLTIVTSFTPDHYENGAWNTGGSCTGKVKPLSQGKLVENEFTNTMHQKQATGFAMKNLSNQSRLKWMDITEVFSYRHDGHPGPYRSPDPNKATKRGRDGRPPPQDCLHWCMPGPVDIWNEFMLELIRRDIEGHHDQNSAL